MDMRKYVLNLIGASVAAGVFPTFHQAFATDASEDACTERGLDDNAAGAVPAARSRNSITNDIAWRPLAT